LSEYNFIFDIDDFLWEKGTEKFRVYVEREGSGKVPAKHVEEGFKLGSWVRNKRTSKKNGKLSSQQIEKLEKLGMLWSIRGE